ncbi:phage holin family protein [Nocardioides gilvus]|uniref:phage holin family protein n=1 Tax=Nocardioides gilvus TaxID=1735589 RepID=UPI000D743A37|nr:phage holin family protein [Nocardioides gilvus]
MATEPIQDTDPTIGRLIGDASRDISSLISKEIQLVKSELKVSAKFGGVGVGLFAAAAFLLLIFIVMLSMTIAFFIYWGGSGLELHWAFGIVTLFYLLVALLLAFIGFRKVKKVKAPERAIRQAKEAKTLVKR